jgi:hypothetical protein
VEGKNKKQTKKVVMNIVTARYEKVFEEFKFEFKRETGATPRWKVSTKGHGENGMTPKIENRMRDWVKLAIAVCTGEKKHNLNLFDVSVLPGGMAATHFLPVHLQSRHAVAEWTGQSESAGSKRPREREYVVDREGYFHRSQQTAESLQQQSPSETTESPSQQSHSTAQVQPQQACGSPRQPTHTQAADTYTSNPRPDSSTQYTAGGQGGAAGDARISGRLPSAAGARQNSPTASASDSTSAGSLSPEKFRSGLLQESVAQQFASNLKHTLSGCPKTAALLHLFIDKEKEFLDTDWLETFYDLISTYSESKENKGQ